MVESHKNSLIQLADMCAGAVARAYNPKATKDKDNWFIALKRASKINDIWEFE